MSLHRRPVGRGRLLAGLSAIVLIIACVPAWWTAGSASEGLPQISGNAFDGPSIGGTVSIKEDGTFTSNLGGQPGAGTFRIADGKAMYEGSTMRGTATLHGSGADQVLRGEGTWAGSPGQSKFELRRR